MTDVRDGPGTSEPTFSIVVPTFHRPRALRETLSRLLALDYDPTRYEVIVVDDGADATTAEIVGGLRGGGVKLTLDAQDRRGAASARNRGARLAGGELLLFIDDDIVVAPDHLQRHRHTGEQHWGALINGSWEFAPDVLNELRSTPFGRFRLDLERQFALEAMGQSVGGGCVEMTLLGTWDLALPRDVFWELNGFDEEFPVAGAEDQDFSLRARAAGCRLLLDTNIRCLHNDDRLTLRAYCEREERSAQTMPFMARKHPREFGRSPYVRENRPVTRGDQPQLVAKKLLKSMLVWSPVLNALERLTGLLEAHPLREPLLWRFYRTLLGLYLFRGFRRTWG